MKLIIDINKEVYKGLIDDTHIFVKPIFDAIKNGIPLEQIRDEVKKMPRWKFNREEVLRIIDKHKGE